MATIRQGGVSTHHAPDPSGSSPRTSLTYEPPPGPNRLNSPTIAPQIYQSVSDDSPLHPPWLRGSWRHERGMCLEGKTRQSTVHLRPPRHCNPFLDRNLLWYRTLERRERGSGRSVSSSRDSPSPNSSSDSGPSGPTTNRTPTDLRLGRWGRGSRSSTGKSTSTAGSSDGCRVHSGRTPTRDRVPSPRRTSVGVPTRLLFGTRFPGALPPDPRTSNLFRPGGVSLRVDRGGTGRHLCCGFVGRVRCHTVFPCGLRRSFWFLFHLFSLLAPLWADVARR